MEKSLGAKKHREKFPGCIFSSLTPFSTRREWGLLGRGGLFVSIQRLPECSGDGCHSWALGGVVKEIKNRKAKESRETTVTAGLSHRFAEHRRVVEARLRRKADTVGNWQLKQKNQLSELSTSPPTTKIPWASCENQGHCRTRVHVSILQWFASLLTPTPCSNRLRPITRYADGSLLSRLPAWGRCGTEFR